MQTSKSKMYTITLRNKKSFGCSEQETLVEAAKNQGIILDHSCLSGRCSTCKIKVISGKSSPKEIEKALSLDDKTKGYILSCIRVPESDMVLDTEDLSDFNIPAKKTIPAKIDSIKKFNKNLIKIELRLPPTQHFEYLSGQYLDVIRGDVRRSYSMANVSSRANKVELFIRNYEGGEMSDYWFNTVQEEDLIRIEGPKGTFFLRDKKVQNLIFLATGTGIAPVKAILEELEENQEDLKSQIYLFWGNRRKEDFFWNPKISDIKLKFFPVLSRDKSAMIHTGYVQDILLQQDLDLSESAVYACGSEKMIKEAKLKLTKKGLPEQNFYSDAFVISN